MCYTCALSDTFLFILVFLLIPVYCPQVPDGATVTLVSRQSKHIHSDSHDYIPGESESHSALLWHYPLYPLSVIVLQNQVTFFPAHCLSVRDSDAGGWGRWRDETVALGEGQ